MKFKNLLNKFNYLNFKNNTFILFQIVISLFYIEAYNLFVLYIYLLMIEFMWSDTNKFLLYKKYCYFIFFKTIILFALIIFENNLFILYIFSLLQFFFICKEYFQNLKQYMTRLCTNKKDFLEEKVFFKLFITNWFYISIIINLFILYFLINNIIISIIISAILISLFKEYKFLLYFTGSIIFIYLLVNQNVDGKIYKDYSISVFSTITNFAILNIATFFIILQLNYQKFNSTFILWSVIKSPASIFAFFPSFIILFSFIFINENNKVLIFRFDTYHTLIFLQVFSILSLVGLVFYTKYFLEANVLLKNIFRNIITTDNNKYILSHVETNLEAIQNLIKNTIIKKDYNTAYNLFFNFACWTKLNINQLKFKSILYRHEKENKFASIFETIIIILTKENDIILQKYFIEAFDAIIFFDLNNENYYEFKIIIDKFREQLLINLENQNDEISIKIYYMLYRNADKILMQLPKVNNCNYPVHQDDVVKQFMDIYIEQNYRIINIAIKYKNIKFLKTFNIISVLFDVERKIQWDGKQLNILISERYNLLKQYKFLITERQIVNFNDFECLLACNYFNESEMICQKDFIDYVIDILISLYLYSIEQKQIRYEDFAIIRMQIEDCLKINNNEHFKLFFRLYIFLIYKMFNLINDDKMKNIFRWLINDIQQRYLSNNQNDKFINEEIKKFLNKCNLPDNYFEEISSELKKSLNSFKSLSETNWLDSLNLDKINPHYEIEYFI